MRLAIIILTLFCLPSLPINSQNSFELIVEDSLSSQSYCTFVDNENYFVSVGTAGQPGLSLFDGLIVRYKNQEEIFIKNFHKDDSLLFFRFGFQLDNGNYFICGMVDDNQDLDIKNLIVLEISNELTIVSERIYKIPDFYSILSIYNLFLGPDSIIIVNGAVDDPAPGLINHLYVAKLNTQGELLDTLISSQFKADPFSEIVEKQDYSGYYFIGSFWFARRIELDTDINIVGYQPMDPNNSYHGAIGARWLSNGNLIVGSLANQEIPGAFYDLRVRITDPDLEIIKDTVIFDDGYNWLPAFSGIDYKDENNIWLTTYPQGGSDISDWEFGRIYLMDANLNVKGAKYWGGTTSLYLYELKALDDGGCIITGITPDQNKKGYTDIFFKKVMPEDILTYAEETLYPYDKDVLIFPNPFSTEINCQTVREDLTFKIFDMAGKFILSSEIDQTPNFSIPTGFINAGFYFYIIENEGRVIQTGKLLKQ